jgi:ABC-2 type transport system ATP-binding protein
VIEFLNVSKRFGARGPAALREVGFTVAAGESVAVVGPNGAGKSTLLALALGFLRPTNGTIRIRGLQPRTFLRRHGAGWVPERFVLPASWRVRSTLEHFARMDGGRAGNARSREALGHFGLEGHADRRVSELSHGLGRRLSLAIATVTPRSLIVLDEPTEGLDAEGRTRFRERCEWLRAHDATVLLASQDLAEVGRIADRVLTLEKGALRDVLALRAGDGALTVRLELERPFERFAEFFPGAEPLVPAVAYHVRVADAAELTARLRGLFDAGATLRSALPIAGAAPFERWGGTAEEAE